MKRVIAKLTGALATINTYIEKKKPTTLAEAEHMLDTIGVIANETLNEAKEEIATA